MMKDEHCKDRLSEYLDGELSVEERARVDSHLEGCAGCAEELEGLRLIAKALGGLPRAELPAGFLDRLGRRRREEEAEAYKPRAWLPAPYRLAAFAATGVLVCVLFVREVRYRFVPQVLPAAAPGDAMMAEAEKMAKADDDSFRARRAEPARWRGLVDGGARGAASPAPEPASAAKATAGSESVRGASVRDEAAPPSKEEVAAFRKMVLAQLAKQAQEGAPAGSLSKGAGKKSMRAEGRPLEVEEGYDSAFTNKDLQDFLQKERERIGIKKIVPSQSGPIDPWDQIPNRPMSRDEAQAAMRRFTAQIRRMNQGMGGRVSVPIGGGTTPQILGRQDISRPVSMGAIPRPKPKMSVAGGAGPRAPAVSGSESLAMVRKKAQEQARRPAKPYPILKSWASSTGGMGVDGGALFKNPEDWRDFWSRVKPGESPPPLDFTKHMAIAVFAGRTESGYLEIRIVSVVERDDFLTVGYRLDTDPAKKGPSAPYHVVLVERSPLQIRFGPVH